VWQLSAVLSVLLLSIVVQYTVAPICVPLSEPTWARKAHVGVDEKDDDVETSITAYM
jgi:hypothetical protein